MADNPLLAALEVAFQTARDMDAPINERLDLVAREVRALSPHFADAVERMIGRLQAAEAGAAAPRIGEMMPDFALPDETGRILTLRAVLGRGAAAISFNRGHWCPYCRLNIVAMAEVQAEIAAAGGQVVAIVPERRKFAAALRGEAQAPFPVLTDMDNGYALSLNLAIWVGTEMAELIGGAGWNVPAYQGNSAWLLPIPATFVVSQHGVVTARYIEPDYRRRMDIDALINALRQAAADQPAERPAQGFRTPTSPPHAAD
jgi:peroxiredoxin